MRTRLVNWIVRPLVVLMAVCAITLPLRHATIDRDGYWRNPTLLDLFAPPVEGAYRATIYKSIQRGTITLNNATSGTATITSVDPNYTETRLLGWGVTGVDVDPSKWFARVALTNATTVTASVNTAYAANNVVGFEEIEYYPSVLKQAVQRGTITTSGSTTATLTAVVTTKTHLNHLGNTTATTTAWSSNANLARIVLTDTTTITATVLSGVDHVISYEAVEGR